jgi:hypothetical protein
MNSAMNDGHLVISPNGQSNSSFVNMVIKGYYRSAVDEIHESDEFKNASFIPQTQDYMQPIRAYEKHLETYFRRKKKQKKWYMKESKVRLGLQCMVDSVIGMVDLFCYFEINLFSGCDTEEKKGFTYSLQVLSSM